MNLKSAVFNLNNLFVLLFVLSAFGLEDHLKRSAQNDYALGFILLLEVSFFIVLFLARKDEQRTLIMDTFAIISTSLFVWLMLTAKLNILPEDIFKAPGVIVKQFLGDYLRLIVDIGCSLSIIVIGFTLALSAAIPLGLFLAFNARTGRAFTSVASFLGSIPPVVFIPYTLALLPSFKACSIFIIFITSFWPILTSTMNGVLNVDSKIINSAKVLNLKKAQILFKIILPASLPQVFSGCNIAISLSFIMLTSAEMIGGGSGLGFYIQYYARFGNFTRIMVGLVVLGIVVSTVTYILRKIENRFFRWKE